MPTIQELRTKAYELKKKEYFENALPLFREIWDTYNSKQTFKTEALAVG